MVSVKMDKSTVEAVKPTEKTAEEQKDEQKVKEKAKAQKILRVDQVYSKKDRQTHYIKTSKAKPRLAKAARKTVLVIRRIVCDKGFVTDIEIDIKSEPLVNTLQEIFADVEGLGLNRAPPTADPKLFFHARHGLAAKLEEEKKKKEPSEGLIEDVGIAMQYITEDFGHRIYEMETLLKKGEITFELLWCLFPPKERVYAASYSQAGEAQAFYLSRAAYGQRQDGSRFLSLNGLIMNHDGEDFGWANINVEIDGFEGTKKISNLNAYPFSYHADAEGVEKELIERGKKFVKLVEAPACREYLENSADTLIHTPDGKERCVKTAVTGRVMIDPTAFRYYGEMYSLNQPWVYRNKVVSRKSLDDKNYLVCPSWVNGFCFATKIWTRYKVSKLVDVTWNDTAFDKLAIAESRRRIIHGLVRAHRNDESAFDDFVQNKGKGMVGLLSGSPGVGKTLTAEVVAEVTRRPLYMASGGELGMDPDNVDKRLEKILEMTRRWSAVLLIDEADVFLAARGKSIAQDTLVSIFLRRIEYFQGVLILTTNRRDEIDAAFESRIHFRLHYPDLDEAKRAHIWKVFTEKSQDFLKVSDADIAELAKRKLNGRQIKNITSCAISLAKDGGKQLDARDVVELMDVIIN